jgi:hypothetical protein
MPVSVATSVPPLSPAEMQLLLSRAGLALNPGQVADLVLAWRQVVGLIASMPRDRPLADDMAYCFRLTPPVAIPGSARPAAAGAAKKAQASAHRRRPAAKTKVTRKRRAARPAGRKPGKRGR